MTSLWDKLDLGLADKIMSATSFNDEQIRLIAEDLQPANKVLDLCVGFVNLAKVLVEQGKTVYGLDIMPESLEYARKKDYSCRWCWKYAAKCKGNRSRT